MVEPLSHITLQLRIEERVVGNIFLVLKIKRRQAGVPDQARLQAQSVARICRLLIALLCGQSLELMWLKA